VLVDAPGHGESSSILADLDRSAQLSGEAGGSGTYIGCSMGGRTALHLALARPELVDALVLIGATGGLDSEQQRAQRREMDEQLATRIGTIGVEAFVDEWLAQPLFASLPEGFASRRQRASNTADGLARSLRMCGTGTQRPLWEELAALSMPVLVLAGERDPKFIELGRRLASCIGSNATFEIVPASGHSTHLENPTATAALIRQWRRQNRTN
jgi:2-succinyl-6-hydroxy-2,4-cyclohexadiene-1-carboxylate synthase